MEKIPMYEFDFGDRNLITDNPKDILAWIESDLHEIKNGVTAPPDYEDDLQYTIKIVLMTQEEIDALPDWS